MLVERTVGEIVPALKHRNDEELTVKIKSFEEKLNVKQKELLDFERALGLASTQKELSIEEKKRRTNWSASLINLLY